MSAENQSNDRQNPEAEERPAGQHENGLKQRDAAQPAGAETAGSTESRAADAGDNGSDPEALQQQLQAQERQVAESRDQVLRIQAELDNLRKRTSRDIENAHKYALEKFISELLPVLDSMELGLSAAAGAEGLDSVRQGMELTLKMFTALLEKFGVRVIDPAGEKFNPEQHEAVSMQEQADATSGTVITVMQKGYELNGRLVRPAMVVVAR